MSSLENEAALGPAEIAPPALLMTAIAVATGALAANLYYAQPLLASIGPELHLRPDLAGTVVSVTQIGYAIGLFFLVSLADLIENKRLVMLTLVGVTIALAVVATSTSAPIFFVASLIVGICSTAAQVLVPFAAHLAPAAQRGRIVGNVMAGLLTGILLARPASLFIASILGWRAVFWLSAGLMVVIGALLFAIMPRRQPGSGASYRQIMVSMAHLVRDLPVLRRRAAYQALMFAAFSLFWTAAPLMLAQRFGLSEQGIALFALAGAGGALAAPLAGRLGDRGYARSGTGIAMAVLAVCFLATGWAAAAGTLVGLAIMAVLLDAAVQTNQILSQRVLFALAGEVRGRINAVYMTVSFIGGAIGSTIATATYHWGGWTATAIAGCAIGVAGLAVFSTEFLDKNSGR